MLPKVSVIIPVYNTEKYLKQCIESVVNQTEKNLQIILVDDGATDSSPKICDAWAEKDNRIQVVHKSNTGLGLTRNAGLDVATGKYISFLDSDDTLDIDTYEKCISKMEEIGAQACYFGRKTMDKDGGIYLNPNIPKKLVYRNKEIKTEFAKKYFGNLPIEEKQPFIQASACCVLYQRDIIENYQIRFCSEREYLSEDTFFNLDICKVAECICILPEYFYNYTYNATSLTKQHTNTKFERCKNLYYRLTEYAKDFSEIEDIQYRMQALFIGYSRSFVKAEIAALRLNGWRETYVAVKRMCVDEDFQKIYRKFPKELFDKNSKIYWNWAINQRICLLMIYYAIFG